MAMRHSVLGGGKRLRPALVFLSELIDGGVIAHVVDAGRRMEAGLRAIAARQPAIKDVRGAGLMWGIELDRPAAGVVQAALELGLLVNRTSDTVVRLLPAYIITEREIDEALPLLERAIASAVEAPRS